MNDHQQLALRDYRWAEEALVKAHADAESLSGRGEDDLGRQVIKAAQDEVDASLAKVKAAFAPPIDVEDIPVKPGSVKYAPCNKASFDHVPSVTGTIDRISATVHTDMRIFRPVAGRAELIGTREAFSELLGTLCKYARTEKQEALSVGYANVKIKEGSVFTAGPAFERGVSGNLTYSAPWLPKGVTLSANGVLTGGFDLTPGIYTFSVRASDDDRASVTCRVTIQVHS